MRWYKWIRRMLEYLTFWLLFRYMDVRYEDSFGYMRGVNADFR